MTEAATTTWRDFLALDDGALLAQCAVDRFRASGPGGQKRNVTDSAVRLRHRPSSLEAQAFESRSQHENRTRALERLRRTIALRLRAPVALDAYEPPPPLAEALARGGLRALGRHSPRRYGGDGRALRRAAGNRVAARGCGGRARCVDGRARSPARGGRGVVAGGLGTAERARPARIAGAVTR